MRYGSRSRLVNSLFADHSFCSVVVSSIILSFYFWGGRLGGYTCDEFGDQAEVGAVGLFVRMGLSRGCMQTQYQLTEAFNPPHEQNKLR